jgi:hypothetical protein
VATISRHRVDDLETARMERQVASLDDATLLDVMLGLLQPTGPEHGDSPMFGGQTPLGAMTTRVAFMEIAQRWIPLDVAAPAFKRLLDDD